MSLIVLTFHRDPVTDAYIDDPYPEEPGRDLAGFEVWRTTVWGAEAAIRRGAYFLPTLAKGDLYVEHEELDAFEAECLVHGHAVRGEDVIALLYGEIRPKMVEALRRCGEHYTTACLTNNIKTGRDHGLPTTDARAAEVASVMSLFDFVLESSVIGARKPEPRFYRLALERLGIEASAAVYLDDLGINLKPARELGMTTIKVESTDQALAELETVLRLPLAD